MSGINSIETGIIWFFLFYVITCSGSYLLLNMVAWDTLRFFLRERRAHEDDGLYTGTEPPITIVVPAYNEGATIVASVRAILQLHYPQFEVIVVNDGSTDNTKQALIDTFEMEPFPEAVRQRLRTQDVNGVYLSRTINNLRLVDKVNGGKADAINVGINLSRYPLFCCIDADSVLERSSMIRIVQPFLDDPDTVASGGTVRIANGCTVKYGNIIRKDIPKHPLAVFQLIEYLRAFLFGRIGWARIRGLLIISGAFGLFKKQSVIIAGGYRTKTIGEDMELVLRMYRRLSRRGLPHRVAFIPDPVCWTEGPERLKDFGAQRRRWHRGLSESLFANRELLFSRRAGPVGWLSFPFFILFEWLTPFVELLGYLFTLYLIVMGKANWIDVSVIFAFAISLSVFLSMIGILLDEITFPGTIRLRNLGRLFLYSVAECFGYRQLNMIYKIQGAVAWLAQTKSTWGSMTRSAQWQK